MEPATTLKELYNNLSPLRYLTQGEAAMRVPIYDGLLEKIRFSLSFSDNPTQTIYISGQSGTGKTTALNFLPNEAMLSEFHLISLDGEKLFDLNDIEIVDLLFAIAFRLVEGRKPLEKKFRDQLERLRKAEEGRIQEVTERESGHGLDSNVETKAGFSINPFAKFFELLNFSADFRTDLRLDRKYRKITREAFAFKKRDLLQLTNQIIAGYQSRYAKGRPLLLIFNELDHIKKYELITQLFIDNRQYLEGLACKKVMSVPVILRTEEDFRGDMLHFGLKIDHNPLISARLAEVEEEIQKNRDLLRQIATRRVDEASQLLSQEAIDYALQQSGGILRQFLSILQQACLRVASQKGSTITGSDAEYAANVVSQQFQGSIISKEKIDMLEEIRTEHKPISSDREVFITAILGNQILAYPNKPLWYDVNPLIRETVRIYAGSPE